MIVFRLDADDRPPVRREAVGKRLGQRRRNDGVPAADEMPLGDALQGWGILFLLAAGPTLLGFGLYNTSLSYLPSSVVNLIVTLEPPFTAIIAYFLLGERLTGMQIFGGLVILAGVVLLRVSEGWAMKRT